MSSREDETGHEEGASVPNNSTERSRDRLARGPVARSSSQAIAALRRQAKNHRREAARLRRLAERLAAEVAQCNAAADHRERGANLLQPPIEIAGGDKSEPRQNPMSVVLLRLMVRGHRTRAEEAVRKGDDAERAAQLQECAAASLERDANRLTRSGLGAAAFPLFSQVQSAQRGRAWDGGPCDHGTVIRDVAPRETDWRKKCTLVSMTADRSLIARLAAHESWANTADPSARTAPARRAMLDRFERQVDPEGVLPPAERARRAGHARKAYFARLALRSAEARRKARAVENGNGRAGLLDEAEPQ